jgi:hypothetical protein
MLGKKNVEKSCEQCGTVFIAYNSTQKFCERKCFKNHNYKRGKKKKDPDEDDLGHEDSFPKYVCPTCKHESQLDFFPTRDSSKWVLFMCPGCKKHNNELRR